MPRASITPASFLREIFFQFEIRSFTRRAVIASEPLPRQLLTRDYELYRSQVFQSSLRI